MLLLRRESTTIGSKTPALKVPDSFHLVYPGSAVADVVWNLVGVVTVQFRTRSAIPACRSLVSFWSLWCRL